MRKIRKIKHIERAYYKEPPMDPERRGAFPQRSSVRVTATLPEAKTGRIDPHEKRCINCMNWLPQSKHCAHTALKNSEKGNCGGFESKYETPLPLRKDTWEKLRKDAPATDADVVARYKRGVKESALLEKGNVGSLLKYWRDRLKRSEHPWAELYKWAQSHHDAITGDPKAWAAWMHKKLFGMAPIQRDKAKEAGKRVPPMSLKKVLATEGKGFSDEVIEQETKEAKEFGLTYEHSDTPGNPHRMMSGSLKAVSHWLKAQKAERVPGGIRSTSTQSTKYELEDGRSVQVSRTPTKAFAKISADPYKKMGESAYAGVYGNADEDEEDEEDLPRRRVIPGAPSAPTEQDSLSYGPVVRQDSLTPQRAIKRIFEGQPVDGKTLIQIFKKFPPDSKRIQAGKHRVMLTGNTAKALDKEPYSRIDLEDLSPEDLDKLAKLLKVK